MMISLNGFTCPHFNHLLKGLLARVDGNSVYSAVEDCERHDLTLSHGSATQRQYYRLGRTSESRKRTSLSNAPPEGIATVSQRSMTVLLTLQAHIQY